MSESLWISRSDKNFRRNQCWGQVVISEAQNKQDFYECDEVMVHVLVMSFLRKQTNKQNSLN